MDVTSGRFTFAIIAASLALAALSRMTWIHVWSVDGVLPNSIAGPTSVHGQDLQNVTGSDGDAVLAAAISCAVIVIVSLSGPPLRRLGGAAIAVAAGLAGMIAIVNA